MNERNSTLLLWEGGAFFFGMLSDNIPHKHHAAQVCFGLDGPLDILLDNSWHKTRFALIPPNARHQLGASKVRLALALIDGSSLQGRQIANAGPLFGAHIPRKLDLAPESIVLARNILDQVLGSVFSDLACLERHEKSDSRIAASTDFIDKNIDRLITAEELAGRACLSQSRFLHLFSQSTGLPMRRYILWRRIILTIEAIKSGADLTSAAHLAGFSDSAHFSRTFRESFGLSPSAIFKNSRNIQVIC